MFGFDKDALASDGQAFSIVLCVALVGFCLGGVAATAANHDSQGASSQAHKQGASLTALASAKSTSATPEAGAASSTSTTGSINTARALFMQSGLQELMEQIPTSTASSFEAALTVDSLPILFADIDQANIRKTVNSAFKFETFDKYMMRQLNQGMSNSARVEMLSWFSSELGARVREAELENSLLTEQDRFEDYQRFLNQYPVSDAREALIQKLDATMQASESAVDMMINIQVAFSLSLSQFLPKEDRFTKREIVDMVKGDAEALMTQYRAQTKDVLLFTYQDLNDDEVTRLITTLATDAGQDFVVAVNEGIKKAMFAASLDLGDGLGALLDDGKSSI